MKVRNSTSNKNLTQSTKSSSFFDPTKQTATAKAAAQSFNKHETKTTTTMMTLL